MRPLRLWFFASTPLVGCSSSVADVGGIDDGLTGAPGTSNGGSGDTGGALDSTGGGHSSSGAGQGESSDGTSAGLPKLDVGATDTGGVVADDCAEGNDLVVVLFEDSTNPYASAPELYRFDPVDGTFTLVAPIECAWDRKSNQYRRLAGLVVDRQARALSFDQIDSFLAIDLTDPSQCTWLSYLPGDDSLANPISQAYVVVDDDDPASERMFVGDDVGQNQNNVPLPGSLGWAELGEASLTTHLVGNTPFILNLVVGTGDGRLFAIGGHGDNPPPVDIVELDPNDATVIESLLTWETLPYPAFYGGDLLMIDRGTQVGPDFVSSAWRYDLDDDDDNGEHDIVEVASDDAFPYGKHPVGVSSPTCIPTTPAG